MSSITGSVFAPHSKPISKNSLLEMIFVQDSGGETDLPRHAAQEGTPLEKIQYYESRRPPCEEIGSTVYPQINEQQKMPWEYNQDKNGFQDLPFVLVFVAVVLCFCVAALQSFLCVSQFHQQGVTTFWGILVTKFNLGSITISKGFILATAIISCSILLGFLQLLGLVFFYKIFIIGGFIGSTILALSLTIYFYLNLKLKLMYLSIAMLILCIFLGWILRSKVAFSTQLIRIGSRFMRSNPSIWIIYTVMILLNTLGVVVYFYVFTLSVLSLEMETGHNVQYVKVSFLLFCGYYFAQIFENAVKVTVGTICCKWYFNSSIDTSTAICHMLSRCCGSICLGSLIMGGLTIVREFSMISKSKRRLTSNPFSKIVWTMVTTLMSIVQFTMKYFNEYAFAYMVLHATGYITSSYKMYNLYIRKGYSTLISESIVKVTLQLYVVYSGIAASTLAFFYIAVAVPQQEIYSTEVVAIVLVSGLVALQITRMVSMLVNAYVHLMLVCLTEYRETLQWLHPQEFELIQKHLVH